MRWDDLHNSIPYAKTSQGFQRHQFFEVPYEGDGWSIRVTFPGDHENDTRPDKGGDYAIGVTTVLAGDDGIDEWLDHLFTHKDLWRDVDLKTQQNHDYMREVFAPALVSVVAEESDPDDFDVTADGLVGVDPHVLLRIMQTLAVCEWRRFWEYEPDGGRTLPTRFALGIAYGRWDARMAAGVWRDGIRGLGTLKLMRGAGPPSFRDVLGRDAKPPHCPFRVQPTKSLAIVNTENETRRLLDGAG